MDTRFWVSTATATGETAPPFGRGSRVFNVIDSRQSYLQDVVVAGLRQLGYTEQAEKSVHFSYEMVALSPRTSNWVLSCRKKTRSGRTSKCRAARAWASGG